MEKKSVSATILVLFLALLFSVIGICFSLFVYTETKIVVGEVKISAVGVEVYDADDQENQIETLKLSDMDLGLKPATGELDAETQIPSTINDEGTSEGYYSKIIVKASGGFTVTIKDIEIVTDNNQTEAEEERKNIFVAIKDVANTTKSLEEDSILIATFEEVDGSQELVIFIWLGSLASDKLEGATINFTLEFSAV